MSGFSPAVNSWLESSEYKNYFILVEPWAVYVKDGEYFESQGGLSQDWGKRWQLIRAHSLEHARVIANDRKTSGQYTPPLDQPPSPKRIIRSKRGSQINLFLK